jgi:hypothetical protein
LEPIITIKARFILSILAFIPPFQNENNWKLKCMYIISLIITQQLSLDIVMSIPSLSCLFIQVQIN